MAVVRIHGRSVNAIEGVDDADAEAVGKLMQPPCLLRRGRMVIETWATASTPLIDGGA